MLSLQPPLEPSGAFREIIRKCETSPLPNYSELEIMDLLVIGTPWNAIPTGDHGLLNRHYATKVSDQTPGRYPGDVSEGGLLPFSDQLKVSFIDSNKRDHLYIWPRFGVTYKIARLSDNGKTDDGIFDQVNVGILDRLCLRSQRTGQAEPVHKAQVALQSTVPLPPVPQDGRNFIRSQWNRVAHAFFFTLAARTPLDFVPSS
jgi:hypothetical protein